jgi:predicted DNA-binding transcriptional regulator AlpA
MPENPPAVEPRRAPAGKPEPLLLSAPAVASLLGFGEAHLWRMHSAGRVPAPVKIGRRTLWRRAEIVACTEAGCPGRGRWAWAPDTKGTAR